MMKMISKTREMKSLLRKGPRKCHLDKKKKNARVRAEFRVLVVRRKKSLCPFKEQKQLSELSTFFVSFQSRKRFRKQKSYTVGVITHTSHNIGAVYIYTHTHVRNGMSSREEKVRRYT